MRRKIVIISFLIALVATGLWFFQPLPRYDTARVDARLLALQQPYRSVTTAYYMDGGSIGIEIVDSGGRRELFAIPSHLGDTNRYTKLFVGAMYDRKPGAVEIIEPEHTMRMLVRILRDYPNRTAWDDFALMALGQRPVDFARCYIRKWRGDYDL